ncbi:MAG: hypothetical protein RIE32_01290 [Phycisphaerales bacterium]
MIVPKTVGMGRNLPYNRTDALEWTLSHLDRWDQVAGEIGLDGPRVQSMRDAAQAARAALVEAEVARARARAATEAWHRLADAMKAEVSASVSLIKTTAALAARTPGGGGGGGEAAERAIYTKAWLSFPGKPSAAPPPETPGLPTTNLQNGGAIVLAWTGRGPAGTRYTVRRKLEHETGWTLVGDTHEKRFVDRTLPIGTPVALYQIVAKHGPHAVAGPVTRMQLGSAPPVAPSIAGEAATPTPKPTPKKAAG